VLKGAHFYQKGAIQRATTDVGGAVALNGTLKSVTNIRRLPGVSTGNAVGTGVQAP